MKFSDLTNDRINLLNTVLSELNVPSLFENPNFLVDEESLRSHLVVIKVNSFSKKSCPMVIMMEEDSIRLDIFGLNESFEWSEKDIKKSRDKIISFFKQIFTSYILIEYWGSPHSKSSMSLFDKNGVFLEKITLRGVIHWFNGQNQVQQLFFPIINKSE